MKKACFLLALALLVSVVMAPGTAVAASELLVPADYATITLALPHASAGDTITVTASITDSPTVNKRVTVRGSPGLASPPTVTGTFNITASGVTVRYLEIDAGGGTNVAVLIGNVTDTVVRDCRIVHAYRAVKVHGNATDTKIRYSTITDFANTTNAIGIHVLNGVAGLSITGNLISPGTSTATDTHAIELDRGGQDYTEAFISDNELTGTDNGLTMLDVDGVMGSRVKIVDNYMHAIDPSGNNSAIWMGNCSYVTIKKNRLVDNGIGISLNTTGVGSLDDITIEHNTIAQNNEAGILVGGEDAGGNPVPLNWGSGNLISNNSITSNGVGAKLVTSTGNVSVDMTYNWWRAASGPYHRDNTAGEGDSIHDDSDITGVPATALIDYDPWLKAAPESVTYSMIGGLAARISILVDGILNNFVQWTADPPLRITGLTSAGQQLTDNLTLIFENAVRVVHFVVGTLAELAVYYSSPPST